MYLYHYPDIWYDYATWHAKNGSLDSATKVYQRALKALPGKWYIFTILIFTEIHANLRITCITCIAWESTELEMAFLSVSACLLQGVVQKTGWKALTVEP